MSAAPYATAAAALLIVVGVYVYRLASGPSVFDRLLGLSGFGTTTTLVLLLIGVAYERLDMFVDLSLAYALLSFVGAVASARYFERGGPQR
ncbi:MAG TPA: monovalent cation/H+ antiporter complex subunit F [Methylomirabilota bacterium]|jgi:multicomponent Na+:H+ antiporter subunit F